MTSPSLRFCARCGARIQGFDYAVRNGLPVHDECAGPAAAKEEPQGPREILAVTFEGQEYADALLKQARALARNVRVVREKIRAEQTWRWGWVVVADAKKEGE
jgi:hypothetical protein